MEPVTQALAKFSANLQFGDLDSSLVHNLKKYLLDGIGCGLYGSRLPWSEIVNGFLKDLGGKEESTLWTQGFKGPSTNVSLGLGVMIHSFDYDDYHNAKIHPGAAVIPAAVTIGERLGASGKSILTAMAAGYETMIRVSLATGPSSSRLQGWHLTGTTGTFASAAAAGNLLGLSPHKMASALGMAGTQSAGLWAFIADGAMSKRFHPGRSSQSGVMAALLAQRGYEGPTQILEAEDGGFCKATSDHVNFSLATEGLGERFLAGDVTVKPHACCGSIHSSIDAAQQLARAHGIKASEIEKVLVKTANVVKVQCGFEYEPLSVLQAQMSLQYCIAVVLLEGQALVQQFAEEKISDPRVVDLAKRVEVVLDPEIEKAYPEKFAGKVEIVLPNGKGFEAKVDYPTGSPENPMSFEHVAEKFESLATTVMERDRIGAIIEKVERLEKLANIQDLTQLLG
jgi:2-methylcitrate dehydratase PrpD